MHLDMYLYTLGITIMCSGLTIFKRALEHMVWHTTGSHRHVGYNVEGVIASWLQIVNNVSGCIVPNNNLIFLIV